MSGVAPPPTPVLGGLGFLLSAEFAAELPLNVRLYVAHIAVIPGLIVGLLAGHFLLISSRDMASPPTRPSRGPASPRARSAATWAASERSRWC